MRKNKGHIEKKGRPPEFRIPEKCKELLDFYTPLKGEVLIPNSLVPRKEALGGEPNADTFWRAIAL